MAKQKRRKKTDAESVKSREGEQSFNLQGKERDGGRELEVQRERR